MITREISGIDGTSSKLDPHLESFSDFLSDLKETAKQALDSNADEYVNAFLIGRLPVAKRNHLSIAGKQGDPVEEIGHFIRRLFQ